MSQMELKNLHTSLKEVISHYQEELGKVRSGRVNPQIIEDLSVDCYGTNSPLKQIALVSAQDARSILISPWDKNSLAAIEKAVKESDLNVNPNNDGSVIRLNFPPLTEERRVDLVKILGKKTEEARIRIRQFREEAWSKVQEQEQSGEISEDEKFKVKEEIQKLVDEYNEKIGELAQKKEKAIMEV